MRSYESVIENIMNADQDDEACSSSISENPSEYQQNSNQDDDDEESEDSAEDEKNMGSDRIYTSADRRLLAKYIASVKNWDEKNDVQRFTPFFERVSFIFPSFAYRH